MSLWVQAFISGMLSLAIADHYGRSKWKYGPVGALIGWPSVWLYAHLTSKGWSRRQAIWPTIVVCVALSILAAVVSAL